MMGAKQSLQTFADGEGLARVTISILGLTCIACLAYTWGYTEVRQARWLRTRPLLVGSPSAHDPLCAHVLPVHVLSRYMLPLVRLCHCSVLT